MTERRTSRFVFRRIARSLFRCCYFLIAFVPFLYFFFNGFFDFPVSYGSLLFVLLACFFVVYDFSYEVLRYFCVLFLLLLLFFYGWVLSYVV